MNAPRIHIDEARLTQQLQVLASFGGSVASGVARETLTPPDLAARRWLLARYATRPGYAVGVDAAANLHIKRIGSMDGLPRYFWCEQSHTGSINPERAADRCLAPGCRASRS